MQNEKRSGTPITDKLLQKLEESQKEGERNRQKLREHIDALGEIADRQERRAARRRWFF